MVKTFNNVLFVCSLSTIAFLVITHQWLRSNVRPWPDEAVYADIARTILTNKRIATSLWEGMIPGVDRMAVWNPPGYFLITAGAFFLFPQNLTTQRAVSTICGVGTLILSILIIHKLLHRKKKIFVWFVPFGLLLDYQFMVSTRLARPEIVVSFLGLLSCWLLIDRDFGKVASPLRSSLCGLCTGAASLIHPLGLYTVFICMTDLVMRRWKHIPGGIRLSYFIAGVLAPLIVWLVSIRNYWPVMMVQYNLAASRKYLENPWVISVFKQHVTELMIVFGTMGIGFAYMIIYLTKTRFELRRWWLVGTAIAIALISVGGRMLWYISHTVPFFYLAFTYVISGTKKPGRLATAIMLALLAANLNVSYKRYVFQRVPDGAYRNYCQGILSLIQDHASVFLSATPDPYYCFLNAKRNNRLTEFPVLPMPLATYTASLNNSEYVILQGYYDRLLFGDYLERYVKSNMLENYLVEDETGTYRTSVVKLKPISMRQ